MTSDIDPEEMLCVLDSGADAFRDIGLPVPAGFPAAVTSLLMIMADIANGNCDCEPCQRLRTTAKTLEDL